MPELPEVETIARELRPLILGRRITTAWTDWPRLVRHPKVGRFLEGAVGHQVTGVRRRAKWLLLELDEALVLPIQPKMTGQLWVVPGGQPRDRYVHLALGLDDGHELRLRDIRKFARVGLYRLDEAGEVLGADDATALFAQHGPEPLDPDFTLAVFRGRLRRRHGRIKPLLLDQAFLAGVGNIYADEALWRARVHPLRHVDSLRPAEEKRLYTAIREVLTEAIARRGASVDDYTAPEGDGEMQEHLDVYQRTGQPCPRCGRPIRRIVIGARAAHLCSWCQRLPARLRTPAERELLARAALRGRRGRTWDELPAGAGAVGTRSRRRVAEAS